MTLKKPAFLTSEWFMMEPDNWHLKEGAPASVKKEFEAFMAQIGKGVTSP